MMSTMAVPLDTVPTTPPCIKSPTDTVATCGVSFLMLLRMPANRAYPSMAQCASFSYITTIGLLGRSGPLGNEDESSSLQAVKETVAKNASRV